GLMVWETPTLGAVMATPAHTKDNRVIVGSLDGKLYSLNGSNGRVTWSKATGPISASVSLGEGVNTKLGAAFDDLAYVSSLHGSIYGIKSDKGIVNWTMALNGPVRAPPTLAYTKVYVGDNSGTVYEVGSLRFATPVIAFKLPDQPLASF